MPREWSTATRDPWNELIRQALKGIDSHTQLYISTKNTWHLEQADFLRNYVSGLKTWILSKERNRNSPNEPFKVDSDI
jgi:hypothetical protein